MAAARNLRPISASNWKERSVLLVCPKIALVDGRPVREVQLRAIFPLPVRLLRGILRQAEPAATARLLAAACSPRASVLCVSLGHNQHHGSVLAPLRGKREVGRVRRNAVIILGRRCYELELALGRQRRPEQRNLHKAFHVATDAPRGTVDEILVPRGASVLMEPQKNLEFTIQAGLPVSFYNEEHTVLVFEFEDFVTTRLVLVFRPGSDATQTHYRPTYCQIQTRP